MNNQADGNISVIFEEVKYFVEYVGKKYGAGDFLIDEEWIYLSHMADEIIKYQKGTADDEDEQYFENLK